MSNQQLLQLDYCDGPYTTKESIELFFEKCQQSFLIKDPISTIIYQPLNVIEERTKKIEERLEEIIDTSKPTSKKTVRELEKEEIMKTWENLINE